MELRHFARLLLRNKSFLIIMIVSALLTAIALTYVISEKYRSSTIVLIRPQKSLDLVPKKEEILNFPVSFYTPVETSSRTYSEIIKSRAVAEKIVTTLHLDAPRTDETHGLLYLWKHTVTGTKKAAAKVWTFLKYGRIPKQLPFDDAVEEAIENLSVKPTKDTYLFEVEAQARSPYSAADLANVAAQALTEYIAGLSLADNDAASKLTEEALHASERKLDASRNLLADYKRSHGIASLGKQIDLQLEVLSGLENSRQATVTKITGLEARQAELQTKLAETQKVAKTSTKVIDNPLIRDLESQLAKNEVKLARLSKLYTPKHKEIESLVAENAKLREELRQEAPTLDSEEMMEVDPVYQSLAGDLAKADTDLASLNAERGRLEATIQGKRGLIDQLPAEEAELARLQLAVALNEETHKIVAKEYEELRMASIKAAPTIEVVHKAVPSPYPAAPIKIYNAGLAAILAAFASIAMVLLIEYVNVTLRTRAEAEAKTGLPVLSAVPDLGPLAANSRMVIPLGASADGTLLPERAASFAESIRALRSNLLLKNGHETWSLMVASCVAGDGGTTVACNLAVSLAELGKRVLLVDADLKRPAVHTIFSVPNETGLSTHVVGGPPPTPVTVKSGLSVIPGGPAMEDPSRLFASHCVARILEEVKGDYEVVLFNGQPFAEQPASALLASKVKEVVLVVGAGSTSVTDVTRAQDMLKKADAKLIGLVLNKVSEEEPL